MNVYTQIQRSVKHHYAAFAEYSSKRYMKELLTGFFVFAVVGAGYVGYNWYQKRQNVQAFAALLEISKSYDQAANKAREQKSLPADAAHENPWEDTQILLEAVSRAHAWSSLAPFFVIYEAQLALDADGDYDKACSLMKKAIAGISKKSIFYDMFNLKYLKMLLDSSSESVQHDALLQLAAISLQPNNYYQQEALSTLASYHAAHGNMAAAIEAWTVLASFNQADVDLIRSDLVTQAQEKLKTFNISLPSSN